MTDNVSCPVANRRLKALHAYLSVCFQPEAEILSCPNCRAALLFAFDGVGMMTVQPLKLSGCFVLYMSLLLLKRHNMSASYICMTMNNVLVKMPGSP